VAELRATINAAAIELAEGYGTRMARESLFAAVTKVPAQPTMMEIALKVEADTGVTVEEMRCPLTVSHIVRPRQRAMHEMRETGLFSLAQIGRFFHRDHTSALHNIHRHKARMKAAGG
jgi:chromosomal replication initiation ATPase DnaA